MGEREAAVQLHTERLVALDAADSGLCFGRLDRRDTDVPRYVGRIGLSAEDGDEEPLLVDWRAPAAQPFYTATPLHDLGVRRRRHIRTRGRTVVSIADETLDLDDPAVAERPGLAGESVLLAALNATRTGRMTDIVRTIQAEQDRIIRADARGVLVVQGGPGTGKTAVALHRAAYLLYTHRERLARSGLLVVGPSPTFLRYIADVLPSLGETGVVLADLGGLRPGLQARADERPEVAEVKGRLAMADVVAAAARRAAGGPRRTGRSSTIDGIAAAVHQGRRRPGALPGAVGLPAAQRGPARPPPAPSSTCWPASTPTRSARTCSAARTCSSRPTSTRCAARWPREPAVHALIDRLWPRLTAERLVRDLLVLPRAARPPPPPGWSDADRELLLRPAVGAVDAGRRAAARGGRRAARRRRLRRSGARPGASSSAVAGTRRRPSTCCTARGRRTARPRRRPRSSAPATCSTPRGWPSGRRSPTPARTAERAAADRTWTYGHVIVDEAQELSAMAWRVLMRRCPTRSMTVVGDVAQTGSPAGAASWAEMLDPAPGPAAWRLEELTVNYRTPAEIMAVADEVLAAGSSAATAGRAVRSTGVRPWALRAADDELRRRSSPRRPPSSTRRTGTLAVLVPPSRLDAVADAVHGAPARPRRTT